MDFQLKSKLQKLAHKLPAAIEGPLRLVHSIVRVPHYAVRQSFSYVRLRLPKRPLKLHLGCGQRQIPGYVNIDFNWSPAVDYRCNIVRLPCPDGSVSRIETYHVIEHIPRPQVEQVLREWFRVLEPGGVLAMECPDFRKDLEEVMAGNEERMLSIFGRQRFPGDTHHWGYTAETLSELVRKVGFTSVSTPPAENYRARREPCIRVEATK